MSTRFAFSNRSTRSQALLRTAQICIASCMALHIASAQRPCPIKWPREPILPIITPTSDRPTILVDGSRRHQKIDGFGASLTLVETDGIYYRHDHTQPKITRATASQMADIGRMLYTELGLTRSRFVQDSMEPQNDNDYPSVLDRTGFNWKLTDGGASFYTGAGKPFGLKHWWTSFETIGGGDAWKRLAGSPCALDPAKLEEHVEGVYAVIERLHQKGAAPAYTAINNEPDLCGTGRKVDAAGTVAMIRSLGRRLEVAGIPTRIVVSDAWAPHRGIEYMRAALADPEARKYIGALAYHSYDGMNSPEYLLGTAPGTITDFEQVRTDIRNLAAANNVPVWMSEVCWCAASGRDEFELIIARMSHVATELAYGASAFDAMNLFFINRPGIPDQLVHIWFNTDGSLQRYEIVPYGRVLSHFSKFVPSGSTRLYGLDPTFVQPGAMDM